jgi:polysaccharide transporter, PST family
MNQAWTAILPAFIRKRLDGRQELQKIVSNSGWLFADKIVRLGVGFFVSVWLARYLGPDQFGLLSYAMAFAALFASFTTLGHDGIVVRDLVREPSGRGEILGSAFVLRLVGGGLAAVLTVTAVMLLRPDNSLVLWLVGIIAIGSVFQAVDVIDFWFQSQVAAKYTVCARNSVFLLISMVKVALILFAAPLLAFAASGLAEAALGAFGLLIVYFCSGQRLISWRWSRLRAVRILRDSWPLSLGALSIAIYMRIDQVMLGEMAGDKAVGIYSAAVRLTEASYCIPVVIVSSLFPAILQSKAADENFYYRRLQRLFSLMVALSLSIAVPVSLLSGWIVATLFGDGFAEAGPILAIYVWASFFVFLGVAQGPWDLAENLTRLALFRLASGAGLNIVLNLLLIPVYGVIGAAVATVISQAFAAVILNVVNVKTRRIFYLQLKALMLFRYQRKVKEM